MGGEFFNFPWYIQVALASGYAGYLTAYAGMRSSHDTTEVVFRTIIFSFVASSIYALSDRFLVELASALVGFLGTLIIAALWRRSGCHWWSAVLHKLRISHSDDAPSALATLSHRTDVTLTGFSILLDDDTWLMCDETAVFANCTHPAVTIGPDGDVAMYVSSIEKGGEVRALSSTINDSFGDRLTYIPAERVKRINLRFRKED